MKKLILALLVGMLFFASSLASSTVSSATYAFPISTGTPPEIPGGGGSEPSLSGLYTVDGETQAVSNTTYTSTTSDQNVILVKNGGSLTISNCTLNKSGDKTSEDNSNFYAVNAVVAVKTNASVFIDHSKIYSNASGANCLFASATNAQVYAYDCEIYSTCSHSRGLEATFKGKVIASKMHIETENDHCASVATDKGNGYISVTDSEFSTAGQGSPLIYSTGVIEVNSVTGTATGAQIAGIEGLSVIRIKNSKLSGSGKQASESVANGVIIYQSMSGDYTSGTATFEVSDSTFESAITNGAMFYITNTKAIITVQNTEFDYNSESNYLLKAAGNNSHGWGTSGSNGGDVTFTAIDQKTLTGNVSVDGISSNEMYLINSTYTGAFETDTATYSGDGGSSLYIDADSTWVVTESCTLKKLTRASDAKIVDANNKTVSIVSASGTKYVTGDSSLKVAVTTYVPDATVESPYAINDFSIDRTAFEAMYETTADPVTPGVASEPYSDAQSATNAAAKINADKVSNIAVPTGLEEDYKSAYLGKVEATVTSDNCVVVDLTAAAAIDEQEIVNAAVTSETAVVALISTNAAAKATISPTTPGLYYWIMGGTEANAVTNAGEGVLSTDGGEVELSKPTLDISEGKAFFKISAGVAAPATSNDN